MAVQEKRNSIANLLDFRLSRTNPWICNVQKKSDIVESTIVGVWYAFWLPNRFENLTRACQYHYCALCNIPNRCDNHTANLRANEISRCFSLRRLWGRFNLILNELKQGKYRYFIRLTFPRPDSLHFSASGYCQAVYHATRRLTHWEWDKMAAVFQTTFSNAFSWMKMYEFRLKFHWSLFLGVQLAIFQHLFR